MSESASISVGIAARYATAVFELARDADALDALSSDMAALEAALDGSADFRALISSPVYRREDQARAITALADKMGLAQVTRSTLGVMAGARRLFVLPQMIARIRALIAEHRGEVTAEITAARALTKAQSDKLAKALRDAMGKDVQMNVTVDEAIIGGLVVKVGSKMVDASVASQLANLKNAMREVG